MCTPLSVTTAPSFDYVYKSSGGDGCGVLFKNGEIIKKVPESALLDELLAEIEKL